MEVKQTNKPKLLVLGGVESVRYKQLAKNTDVSYVPKVKKFKNAEVAQFDAVVMLTSQLAHATVKSVKKTACKNNIPVYFLSSSGVTRFKCLLKDICGSNCSSRL